RADHAQAARVVGRAGADFALAGHVVEVQPRAVRAAHDALRAQDRAVALRVQLVEDALQFVLRVGARRLRAEALEHLVRRVAVVVMVLMVMLMIVAAAAAALAVVVVMMMFMLMLV